VRSKQSFKKPSVGGTVVLRKALGEPRDLLSTLFKSSTVGVAICDRQFRYRAVNDALASMNGLPASEHLGKTLRAVLGAAATKIQPAIELVFATGQPLSNYEVTAELPARVGFGHWIESYFPIKDEAGVVHEVGVIVLELTKRNEIEAALLHITENLISIRSSLRTDSIGLEPLDLGTAHAGAGDVIVSSLTQLENCMSEARTISQLLSAPQSTTMQLSHTCRARPLQGGRGQNLATVHALGGEHEGRTPLSVREREVVALLAKGKTNKEIATLLVISSRTVESHRARIMLKLDLDSISELVRYAVRTKIIRL
jgi:DNA-binding CsgD family transcriptional regulator